jgi:hypothetical protein
MAGPGRDGLGRRLGHVCPSRRGREHSKGQASGRMRKNLVISGLASSGRHNFFGQLVQTHRCLVEQQQIVHEPTIRWASTVAPLGRRQPPGSQS